MKEITMTIPGIVEYRENGRIVWSVLQPLAIRERLIEIHDLIFNESNCYDTVEEPPCLCGLCVGSRKLREMIDEIPSDGKGEK
jgi:hypothetical protein